MTAVVADVSALIADPEQRSLLEAALVETLSRGPCAADVTWLCERLGWAENAVEAVAENLEAAGVLTRWTGLRDRRLITLEQATVDRLGLVVISDQGSGWWGVPGQRIPGLNAARVNRRGGYIATQRHSQALESTVDRRGINPFDEAVERERFEAWRQSLPSSNPDRKLSWPIVHTGCQPWRFRDHGGMWPPLDGESPREGECPACHGAGRNNRGLLCLVCLPSRGVGPERVLGATSAPRGLRGGRGA